MLAAAATLGTELGSTYRFDASCSFKGPMILSSGNLLGFLSGVFGWAKVGLKLDGRPRAMSASPEQSDMHSAQKQQISIRFMLMT